MDLLTVLHKNESQLSFSFERTLLTKGNVQRPYVTLTNLFHDVELGMFGFEEFYKQL